MTSTQENSPSSGIKLETLKLLNVQIFFRHGARTPLRCLEGVEQVAYDKNILNMPLSSAEVPFQVVDFYTNESLPFISPGAKSFICMLKGGMYTGMLTTKGKEQMYQLGQRIKQRYVDDLGLISKEFNRGEVYIRSSHFQRTIESLQCVIGGMYGVEQFQENGPLQIPVKDGQIEDLVPNSRSSNTLRQIREGMIERLLKNTYYKEVLTKVQPIIGTDEYIDLVLVYDHITSRKTHGLKLEQWMIDMEDDIAKAAIIGIHSYIQGSKEHLLVANALAIGQIYQMIEDNMRAAMKNDNSTQKLHLYSCHDTTIFPLMMVLGHPMKQWPPYAADIKYELYEDNDGKHWVQILFCDKVFIPSGCENSLITFNQFQEIIKRVKLTSEQYTVLSRELDAAKEFAEMILADTDVPDVGT